MHVILTIYAHVLLIICKLWYIQYIYMYIYMYIQVVYTIYTNHTAHHSCINVGNTRPIPAEQNLRPLFVVDVLVGAGNHYIDRTCNHYVIQKWWCVQNPQTRFVGRDEIKYNTFCGNGTQAVRACVYCTTSFVGMHTRVYIILGRLAAQT